MALKERASIVITIVLMHLGKFYVSSSITDVQLIGGPASNKGTIEIRQDNGRWETTCGNILDINDVMVICRQLGFPGASRAITNTSYYGHNHPSSTLGLVCSGWEADLHMCPFYPSPSCPPGAASCYGDGYLGCFVDNYNDRVLPGESLTNDPDMTISYCIQYCNDSIISNYTYVGVQNGDECYCGEASANYARLGMGSDGDCQSPCSGDPTDSCGGPDYIAVFTITQTTDAVTTPSPGHVSTGDGYLGCFVDNYNDRVLPGESITNDPDMTISFCIRFCNESIASNYTYAGVQNGDECYCGKANADYARLGMGSDGDCQSPCSGDPTDSCGGPDYVAVFTITQTTDAMTTPSPSHASTESTNTLVVGIILACAVLYDIVT